MPASTTPPAISFQSITKRYPLPKGVARGGQAGVDTSTFAALDGVSFDIAQGEFFGLLGPNGAGKTTLISILAGLTRASSGQVTVLGHDVQTDYAAARSLLGVVPQELVFDPFFNVREAMTRGVKHQKIHHDQISWTGQRRNLRITRDARLLILKRQGVRA
ncbi:ATP-binding cassette domain-containing protein, partial [Leptospira sp. 96542]|nr:ATP-binding cassette domain-containing protein [Leptospira sp. 96542]